METQEKLKQAEIETQKRLKVAKIETQEKLKHAELKLRQENLATEREEKKSVVNLAKRYGDAMKASVKKWVQKCLMLCYTVDTVRQFSNVLMCLLSYKLL